MSQLNLALTTDADKGLVYKSGNKSGWPDGLASTVMELMEKRYNARDNASLLAMRHELLSTTMGEDEEPAAMFGRLMKLKNRYDVPGDVMDEKDLMAVAIKAAPAIYHSTISNLQLTAGTALNLDDIEEAMSNHYLLVMGSNSKGSDKKKNKNKDGEYQLAAVQKNKKGCWDCGNLNHKAGDSECPKKGQGLNKRNARGKNTGKACATCGKIHKGPCWEDPRNVHLRPANWKSSKAGAEVNATSVQNNNSNNEILCCGLCLESPNDPEDGIFNTSTELGLVGLTFPQQLDLLKNPNIFIADTGSTCHSTAQGGQESHNYNGERH